MWNAVLTELTFDGKASAQRVRGSFMERCAGLSRLALRPCDMADSMGKACMDVCLWCS